MRASNTCEIQSRRPLALGRLAFQWLALFVLGSMASADDLDAKLNRVSATNDKSSEDSIWCDPQNQLTVTIGHHTSSRGRPYTSIIFLLRDREGGHIGVGLPGNNTLEQFFLSQFEAHSRNLLERSNNAEADQNPLAVDAEMREKQLKKLRLAGQLDVQRLMRKIRSLNEQVSQLDPSESKRSRELLLPLHKVCEDGLFTRESLYERVLAGMADTPK